MVFIFTSFFVLPVVLATTIENQYSDCVALVDNAKSLFGQSEISTSPTGLYPAHGLRECMEKCCNLGTYCNVGLFIESATNDETNCKLYECRPLEKCSLEIKDGFQVFVHTDYLEEDKAFSSSSAFTPLQFTWNTVTDNISNEGKSESTITDDSFTESNVKESPITFYIAETTTKSTQYLGSNDWLVEASSITQVSTEIKFAYQATPTLILANTEEAIGNLTSDIAGLETVAYKDTAVNFLSSQYSTSETATFDSSYQLDILPTSIVTGNESTANDFSRIYSVIFSDSIITDKPIAWSDTTESSSQERMLETSFLSLTSDDVFSNLVTMETIQASSTSGDIAAEEVEDKNSLSSIPVMFEMTVTSVAGTISSTALISNDAENTTLTENANGGVQKPEAFTAILICTLTFGCLCTVAVVGVLGVRVYEGYRKRHYSRLDYLINGMYS